jgi:UPF0716 protein FxsA
MRFIIMLLPWLELYTLVQLGIQTSALTAVGYAVGTLFLGLLVLRRQGKEMLGRLRQLQSGGVIGPDLLVDDVAMGLAGALLMFPGMISDVAALIVMIGPLRRRIARAIGGPQPEPYVPERDRDPNVIIEGQFRRVNDREKS